MPTTIVASVKIAPTTPNTMGIVRASKVLDADADAELVVPGVWVALAFGPRFARSMFGK